LISVAAALEIREGVVQNASLVLGGVAHKPWPVPEAAGLLRRQRPDAARFGAVAEEAFRGAIPRRYNGFKIELGKRAVVRALSTAASLEETA